MKLQKLILVLSFVLMLAGCGSSTDANEETVAAQHVPPTQKVEMEQLKSQMTIENAYGQEIRLVIAQELLDRLSAGEVETALMGGYGKDILELHIFSEKELRKSEQVYPLQYVYLEGVGLVCIAVNEEIVNRIDGAFLAEFLNSGEAEYEENDIVSLNDMGQ